MAQSHMDKLRAVRGLPPQTRENLMGRTRAAVAYCNTGVSERAKMHAFLALFHPEIEPGTLRHIQLVNRPTDET